MNSIFNAGVDNIYLVEHAHRNSVSRVFSEEGDE